MFSKITWSEYIITVLVLLVAYYVFVLVKFYSKEVKLILTGKIRLLSLLAPSKVELPNQNYSASGLQETQLELFGPPKHDTPSSEETNETLQQVEYLTSFIKEAIANAVSKNYIKEEFILSLQLLLKNYASLKNSPFLVATNNLIASECEKYGYILLSAEERVMLWDLA